MASDKEKMGKDTKTQAKNVKQNRDRDTARSEKRIEERSGAGEKSNRSSSKVKMPALEAGKSNRTTDHDVIRQWAEDRDGSPATVKATEGKNDPGLLRINFPGYSGKYSLENISWEDFFKKFDEKNLEFLYQEQTRTGKTSRFFKFVNPSGSKNQEERGSRSPSHSGSKKKEG